MTGLVINFRVLLINAQITEVAQRLFLRCVQDVAGTAGDKAQEAVGSAKEKAQGAADSAGKAAQSATDGAAEGAGNAADAAGSAGEQAGQAARGFVSGERLMSMKSMLTNNWQETHQLPTLCRQHSDEQSGLLLR